MAVISVDANAVPFVGDSTSGEGNGSLWPPFRKSLILNAQKRAILWRDEVWTYRNLADAAVSRAEQLAAAGVQVGSRVVFLISNGPGYAATELAVMALGAVKVPINPVLQSNDIERVLQRVRPDCVVVSHELADRIHGLPWCDSKIVIEHHKQRSTRSVHEMKAALEGFSGAPADSPAVIFFSSGTTGAPKGIVHSQAGILSMMWLHLMESGIGSDELLLLTTPLAHAAGGFLNAAMLRGATIRIEEKFSTIEFLERVQEDRVSWTFVVPTILFRLVAEAERAQWDTASLRTIQYGASPIAPELLRRAMDKFGPVLQQLYGLTECPNYISQLTKEDHVLALTRPEMLTSAGKPCLWSEVTIRDETGVAVESNAVGEVCVQSPLVMVDYWEDPDGYSSRFHGRNLRSGDIGYLDDNGYLYLMDRASDMIITGGLNVYSTEVENALSNHPWVSSTSVIGIPHEEWGESIHAFVVLDVENCTAEPAAAPAELIAYLRTVLTPYKRPKSIELIDQIPMTQYGKPDKKKLREPYWGGASRNIG